MPAKDLAGCAPLRWSRTACWWLEGGTAGLSRLRGHSRGRQLHSGPNHHRSCSKSSMPLPFVRFLLTQRMLFRRQMKSPEGPLSTRNTTLSRVSENYSGMEICLPLLMTEPPCTQPECGISDVSKRTLSTGDVHPLAHLADSCPSRGTRGQTRIHPARPRPRLHPSCETQATIPRGTLLMPPGAARQAAGHRLATSSRGFLIALLLGRW